MISRRAGFTLLEVMLAVFVLATIALSLFRFVEVNLTAVRISTETTNTHTEGRTVIALVQSVLASLPPPNSEPAGAFSGQAHKFQDRSADEMTWLASSGDRMLTDFADGKWNVTLTLKPTKDGSNELGLRRTPLNNGSANWLHLLDHVDGMELRYFDPRSNGWGELWNDRTHYPALVRIRIWRNGEESPSESVIQIPRVESVAPPPPAAAQRGGPQGRPGPGQPGGGRPAPGGGPRRFPQNGGQPRFNAPPGTE